jgi:ribosomal protein S18 acetylase RimI-like enzyme
VRAALAVLRRRVRPGRVMTCADLVIVPLQPGDTVAVRALLIAGLTERWGDYDARLNPDLATLASDDTGFTVLVAKSGQDVVATASLRLLGTGRAELVRMSVARQWRRRGVGSLLLQCLLTRARERGACEVVLETTSTWHSAVNFYTHHGFRKTGEHGDDTHFILRLTD